MSFLCFETRQGRLLAPYPPPEFAQSAHQHWTKSQIVDHVISNIPEATLKKIKKQITLSLQELVTPRDNHGVNTIPRPQNAFLIYRRDIQAKMTKEKGPPVVKQLDHVSKIASGSWAKESKAVIALYEIIAQCQKTVHKCLHPGYVYQPRQPKKNALGADSMKIIHMNNNNTTITNKKTPRKRRTKASPNPPSAMLPSPPPTPSPALPSSLSPLINPQHRHYTFSSNGGGLASQQTIMMPLPLSTMPSDHAKPGEPATVGSSVQNPPLGPPHSPKEDMPILDVPIPPNKLTTYDQQMCRLFDHNMF